ncbi:hypothetical protein Goari_022520, partial [Gossypium aridum]|nr:hypothetical protein [Gossypium aridum]
AESEKAKESQTNVCYAYVVGNIGYATLNAKFAEKKGREPSRLEQFRFQYLRKDGSDKLSSEVAEQDEACKRVKDFLPTTGNSFTHQDNVALENEEYTQVFDPDKYGKVLGYGRGITKSILFGYGSVTRGSQFTLAISTLIEEMSTKHAEQIQQSKPNKQFKRRLYLRKQNLDSIQRLQKAKFMDMMDAREKKYKAFLNECMAKGMS